MATFRRSSGLGRFCCCLGQRGRERDRVRDAGGQGRRPHQLLQYRAWSEPTAWPWAGGGTDTRQRAVLPPHPRVLTPGMQSMELYEGQRKAR